MLKEYDVKQDVITLCGENLNSTIYLIQHGQNKNLDSYSQLIKNLVDRKVVSLEHMDNKEQLTIMFKANKIENINSGIETCTIQELQQLHIGRNATDSLYVLHVLMHKQSAMVKPVRTRFWFYNVSLSFYDNKE